MTTRQKPVKVKKGSVEVRIYRREKDSRVYYQIADYSSGKRRVNDHPIVRRVITQKCGV